MRTIIISTDKPSEYKRLTNNAESNYVLLHLEDKQILVFNNSIRGQNFDKESEVIKSIVGSKVLLYHNVYANIKNREGMMIFPIGTGGNIDTPEGSNRWYFEKLLAEQFVHFDQVWLYFQSKILQRELYTLKTSFLDEKIYTNTCPMTLPSELSTQELVLLFEPIKGKEFNRNDQSYMVHFEKFKSRLNELYQDIL